MRKKIYVGPEMNVIALDTTDIITTSTEAFDGEWVPIGGQNDNDEFLPTE